MFSAFVYFAAATAAAAEAAAAAQHVSCLCVFSSLHRVPLRFASKLGSTRSSECDERTDEQVFLIIVVDIELYIIYYIYKQFIATQVK